MQVVFSQEVKSLAIPSPVQYKWHEQERIMFLCLDPCTWQGREYDDHSIPLSRINHQKLNTDQCCETAQLWGAKEILFVAKHTGGFCWWQTKTTDYGIKYTPYKNGKGDVLKEFAESCKKYGLNLGIYVYPGDKTWGTGIGSGGLTSDPSKQEAYNKIYRQQLTEVLSKYGEILEVWFDGSCKIDVSDILEKYAKNSFILQGPQATLRWTGTESGKLFYPVWNNLKSEDLKTGVAKQVHDDPNGDAWAPMEANTTLYDHYWFWSPQKEKKCKLLEDFVALPKKGISPWSEWQDISVFSTKENPVIEVDLTGKIKMPGQFIVRIVPEDTNTKIKISNVDLIYDGRVVLGNFTIVKGNEININRTAQVTGESKISLRFKLKGKTEYAGKIQFKPALIY